MHWPQNSLTPQLTWQTLFAPYVWGEMIFFLDILELRCGKLWWRCESDVNNTDVTVLQVVLCVGLANISFGLIVEN